MRAAAAYGFHKAERQLKIQFALDAEFYHDSDDLQMVRNGDFVCLPISLQ